MISKIFSFVSMVIITIYLILTGQNIKTYWRLNEQINFDPLTIYPEQDFEKDLLRIFFDGRSQGVYVLCTKPNSSKTTIIKKILHQIQYFGGKSEVKVYYIDNTSKNVTLYLKPVYIDVSKLQIQKNNIDWFANQFGKNGYGNFVETIPENNKAIIVLDHMSRDIIDGFNNTFETSSAKCFYTALATQSYNTGLKYVVLVVTNDEFYAHDILMLNSMHKFHSVIKKRLI